MAQRTLRQLIVFTFMGAMSAGIDFGGYLLLTRLVPFFRAHYITASFLSATAALFFGFFSHRRWTFRAQHLKGFVFYARFFAVYISGIILQNVLLATFVHVGIVDWLAKVIAILIIAYGWNFLLAKYWVFRYTTASSH